MDELLADPAGLEEMTTMTQALSGFQPSPEHSGCTAVVCCVRQDSIVVANAGDSRAVLCRRGKAIDLSEDHKPNLPTERNRIERAGGFVVERDVGRSAPLYRVNG